MVCIISCWKRQPIIATSIQCSSLRGKKSAKQEHAQHIFPVLKACQRDKPLSHSDFQNEPIEKEGKVRRRWLIKNQTTEAETFALG